MKNPVDKPRTLRYNNKAVPNSYALVAQLDRVSDYESEGQGFESLRARQTCGEQFAHRRFFLFIGFVPAFKAGIFLSMLPKPAMVFPSRVFLFADAGVLACQPF